MKNKIFLNFLLYAYHKHTVCYQEKQSIMKKSPIQVLAQLPTSNSTINLFHNPMGAIDDIEIQLMCTGFDTDRRQEPETVKFFLSCNDTSVKDVRFAFGCNYKSLNTSTHAWDVISRIS